MLAGASMVMPGPDLSPGAVLDLLESEKVTVTAGVPTIWMGMLPLLDGRDLSALRMIICGGSAVPAVAVRGLPREDRHPDHAGLGHDRDLAARLGVHRALRVRRPSEDEKADIRATAGIAPPGVELRIVDSETREPQPWDDKATGELEARGPWVAKQYYRTDEPGEQFSPDGWLRTGDVAAISPLGYIRLVDRTKDLVKSGGEWISSVDLENQIMGHPKIAEAAVIAVPHPKWSERPLACVVVKDGEELTREEVLEFLARAALEVAAARRRRVHRRGAEDQRRQVLEEDAAGQVRRLPAADGLIIGARRVVSPVTLVTAVTSMV